MNGAACDSFQLIWNCSFLFVQITYNACYTYDVPTQSKLPVPVDLVFLHIYYLYYLSPLYDDRCSNIASVYLLGSHFRSARMRPMALAVSVNNMMT